MSDNKLISVIVPMFNSEKTIERCVNSIIKQTYENIEIILVNDNSNDNTLKLCKNLANNDKRIKIINNKLKGVASARNTGVENAKGDYIGFVDSDDYIEPNMYRRLYDNLNIMKADISVCGYVQIINQNKIPICKNNIMLELGPSESLKYMINDNYNFSVCPWNKLVKRKLYNEVYYPNGIIYDDLATTYKLIIKAKKVVYFTEELYNYTISDISTSRKEFYNEDVKMRNVIVKKMYDDVTKIFPELQHDFINYKIVQSIAVINSMIKSDCYEKIIYENYKEEVKSHIDDILRSTLLNIKKKVQIILLFFNFEIYKKIYIKSLKK